MSELRKHVARGTCRKRGRQCVEEYSQSANDGFDKAKLRWCNIKEDRYSCDNTVYMKSFYILLLINHVPNCTSVIIDGMIPIVPN